MTWQIAITLSVLSYSLAVVVQRMILREDKSQPIAYSIFFQFLTGVIIGIVGFFISDMRLPVDLGKVAVNLVALAVLY